MPYSKTENLSQEMKKQVINLGDIVICDSCNKDYTDDPRSGGIQFQSKAICPECAPSWEQSARDMMKKDLFLQNVLPNILSQTG